MQTGDTEGEIYFQISVLGIAEKKKDNTHSSRVFSKTEQVFFFFCHSLRKMLRFPYCFYHFVLS